MQPVYLYTEEYFAQSKLKSFIKKLLGRYMRGPKAVETSLIKGLIELGVPYALNLTPKEVLNTVGVLSGVKTLKQVIEWKKMGLVKKIVAGPNLVITPEDENGIIKDPAIDVVIQPSQWSADFYKSLEPELARKIIVWPAGVEIPENEPGKRNIDFLIYNKIGNSSLVSFVENKLKEKKLSYSVIKYGKFLQKDYFKKLEQARYLVYLSNSESQGLAMFEAFARGVPVLSWERGFWEYGPYKWTGSTGTEYIKDGYGLVFKGENDFEEKLNLFLEKKFNVKELVQKEHSLKTAAEKYLEIYLK